MNSISMEKLLEQISSTTLNIIDIRSYIEYNRGHIPTAKNIPSRNLSTAPQIYLEKTKKYYIYCQSGNTSSHLSAKLNREGYNTINVIGGYNNYLLMK